MDRGETRVAGAHAVAAIAFQVGEERADQRRVEILEADLRRRLASLRLDEPQQQPKRVTVGSDRVRAGVTLVQETIGEVALEQRSESAHDGAPDVCSRRSAASASSSGAASKYQ